MAAEQLPLEHVHHRRRVLAAHVVTLQSQLSGQRWTSLRFDDAYREAEQLTEDELVELRRSLESQVAERKRGAR